MQSAILDKREERGQRDGRVETEQVGLNESEVIAVVQDTMMWPECVHGSGCRKDGNPYGLLQLKCLNPSKHLLDRVPLPGDITHADRTVMVKDQCRLTEAQGTHLPSPTKQIISMNKEVCLQQTPSLQVPLLQTSQHPSRAVGKHFSTIFSASQLMCIETAPKGTSVVLLPGDPGRLLFAIHQGASLGASTFSQSLGETSAHQPSSFLIH